MQRWWRSVGGVRPWSGDISDNDGLVAAVDARGFAHGSNEQRELILILGEHAVCCRPSLHNHQTRTVLPNEPVQQNKTLSCSPQAA